MKLCALLCCAHTSSHEQIDLPRGRNGLCHGERKSARVNAFAQMRKFAERRSRRSVAKRFSRHRLYAQYTSGCYAADAVLMPTTMMMAGCLVAVVMALPTEMVMVVKRKLCADGNERTRRALAQNQLGSVG